MATDTRVERLEVEVERLAWRLERLEGKPGAVPAAGEARAPQTAPAVKRLAADPAAPGPARWSPPVAASPVPRPRRDEAASRPAPWRKPASAKPLEGRSLEDLLGGQVLAWVGGLAVLIGVALLFAVAVSRGWIDEAARTLVAGAGSAALLALGVYLFEKRGRSEAALAAVGTGVSALFVTITVAAQVYELVPALVALLMVVGVGSLATALAVRWESKGIAALGIVGGLFAPVLAGAPADLATMAILLVAAASAVGVVLRQRWEWLTFAVLFVTLPQWLSYVFGEPSLAGTLAVLTGFGVMGAAAAAGYEVRCGTERLRTTSAFALGLNAIVLAVAGWLALEGQGAETLGKVWLAGLAAAHVALGLAARRSERTAHDFGLLALVIGVVVADVAFSLAVEGPVRALGFAGATVFFAALVRRRGLPDSDSDLSTVGLGVHVALGLMQALMGDAPPELLEGGGVPALGAAVSVLGVAAGCFVSARLADAGHGAVRIALDAVGLAMVAYLTALVLDGATLAIVWAVEGVLLARLGGADHDPVATWGGRAHVVLGLFVTLAHVVSPALVLLGDPEPLLRGSFALGALALAAAACSRLAGPREVEVRAALDCLAFVCTVLLLALLFEGVLLVVALAVLCVAFCEAARVSGDRTCVLAALASLGLALGHALAIEAPPDALVRGLEAPGSAAIALAAVALAAVVAARSGAWTPAWRDCLVGVAGVVCLYLASVLVVTPFGAGDAMAIGLRQEGQVLLSALWSVVGVAALVIGLRRDLKLLRLAALALLLATVGKVFLYDLATLTSIYRVVSFVALGLLLLLAGFLWERMRPRPVPDMREVPEGVR